MARTENSARPAARSVDGVDAVTGMVALTTSDGAVAMEERGHGTFASLRHAGYRHLFIAGLFVFTAIQGQQIARGWLARELTGTNSGLGGVYLGFGLPMLLLTPIGGVLADRWSKRTVMLVATGLLTASAAWIAIADTTGVLRYWMLVASSGVQAAGFAVYGPARVAFTAELVDRTLVPNAIALTQTGLSGTRVVAPTLAGALIGVPLVGTAGVYVGGTALLAVSMVLSWLLPDSTVRTAPARSPSRELADGFRYLRAQQALLRLVLISTVVIVVGMPYLAFLPTVADGIFEVGPAGYGVMNGVAAVAALAVSLWVAGRSRLNQAWTIQSVMGVAFGFGLVGMALSPTFLIALLGVAIVGGAVSGFQAMNNTLVLTESDPEYHGRVQSFIMVGFSGFGFAALPLGITADTIGLRQTFAGMGAVILVAMWLYLLARRRRRNRNLVHEVS